MAGVDARMPLGLGVMQLAGGEDDLCSDEGMVRVTLSAVQAPGAAYGVEVLTPGQDQVQVVPVLGSGVVPGDLVLELVLKECVAVGQLVEGAQIKEPLTVLVHLANAWVSEGGRACIMVNAHLCVEVPKDVESFIAGHASGCPIKGIIGAVLLIGRRGQHWSIG